MSRSARGTRPSRISPLSWIGAIAVHAVIAALLLQFGTEPAQSNVPSRPDVEAVRVQAADEELLEQRREAHRQALREEELRKQREREAKRKETERKQAEKRKRDEAARRAAEEKKAKARAEAKRKAEKEAKRKLAEKRKREESARRAAEEEKKRAAERAETRRKAEEEARRLQEAEQRAEARRQERVQRRQREAARQARQADIWRIAIKKKIKQRWLPPPATHAAPCEAVVEQDEKGEVLSVGVRGCQASQAWQDSLRNAVLKASPLPRPPVAELFDRHLVITFHPKVSH